MIFRHKLNHLTVVNTSFTTLLWCHCKIKLILRNIAEIFMAPNICCLDSFSKFYGYEYNIITI